MGRQTVVVNGCFDIIHPGHTRLIEFAARMGDLVILINSDNSVRVLKGDHKPYMTEDDRAEVLRAVKGVRAVMIFSSQTDLYNLYRYLTPDILVIGEEYRHKEIIGSEFVKNIVFFPVVCGQSSSNIAKVIRRGIGSDP